MRKIPLIEGEYYHIYNRGVDKRDVFQDRDDLDRFFQSMKEFNVSEPIGSLYLNSFNENKENKKQKKLVEFVAYCLNPNHFHILIKQVAENGISEFMKRLSGGYTLYFNNKHKRTGSLFGGKFKSVHIDSDTYLLHVSAYINLNNLFKGKKTNLSKSSWEEYIGKNGDNICNKDIILAQFKNSKEYEKFASDSLKDILERKELDKELVDFNL